MRPAPAEDSSFSWDRLSCAAQQNSGVLVGFGVALMGTFGFLVLALTNNRTPQDLDAGSEPWTA